MRPTVVQEEVYLVRRSTLTLSPPINLALTTRDLALPTAPQMSTTSKQATLSSISNFTSILDAAAKEYKMLTKKDLSTHPFAVQFHKCDTPHAVLDVFRNQAQAFEEFRKGDDRLITWLDPTINILFTCSETIGEALSLVVCLERFPSSVPLLPDDCSSALLSCKNDLYRHWLPPHCRSLIKFVRARMHNL